MRDSSGRGVARVSTLPVDGFSHVILKYLLQFGYGILKF